MPREAKPSTSALLAGLEIVPLGGPPANALGRLASGLGGVLACPVSLASVRALPEAALQSNRGQYNVSMILNAIRPVVWKKGWKRLGVLDVDIFAAGLDYVFGQADLAGSTAAISLARLSDSFYGLPYDPRGLLERASKEAVHEIGHTLGLVHCKSPRCVMYFSNSLVDTDAKHCSFCPACKSHLAQGGH